MPRLQRSICISSYPGLTPGPNLWSHLRCSIHPGPFPFCRQQRRRFVSHAQRLSLSGVGALRFTHHLVIQVSLGLAQAGAPMPQRNFSSQTGGACGPSIIGAFGFEMRVMFFGKIANLRTRRPARSSFRLALSTPALAKLGCGSRGLTQDERDEEGDATTARLKPAP